MEPGTYFGVPSVTIEGCGEISPSSQHHCQLALRSITRDLPRGSSIRFIEKTNGRNQTYAASLASPVDDANNILFSIPKWADCIRGIYIPRGWKTVLQMNGIPASPEMKCSHPSEEVSTFEVTQDVWDSHLYFNDQHILYKGVEYCRVDVQCELRSAFFTLINLVLSRDGDNEDSSQKPEEIFVDLLYTPEHTNGETSVGVYVSGLCTGFTKDGIFIPVDVEEVASFVK